MKTSKEDIADLIVEMAIDNEMRKRADKQQKAS